MDFGVSLPEAQRRIATQPAVEQLQQTLTDSDSSFGGLWVDQANDGTVHVLTLAKDDVILVSTVAQLGLATDVRVDIAKFTWNYLVAGYYDIANQSAHLQTPENPIAVKLDVVAQQLDINSVGGEAVSLTPDQQHWADSLKSQGYPVVVGHQPQGGETTCIAPYCDAPARGGVAMLESLGAPSDGTAYCTEGFNVRSATNALPYMLTAGHCGLEHSGTWYEKQVQDGVNHVVGTTWHSIHSGNTDAAIVSVNNPGGWGLPSGFVLVNASSGGHPTAYNELYNITSIALPSTTGGYLCKTGATNYTVCGVINSTYASNVGISDEIEVHFRTCQGDSGGPAYIAHAAYGIVVSGYNSDGSVTGINGVSQTCYSNGFVVKMRNILGPLNVDLDYS